MLNKEEKLNNVSRCKLRQLFIVEKLIMTRLKDKGISMTRNNIDFD
jgi:hypothetical protein